METKSIQAIALTIKLIITKNILEKTTFHLVCGIHDGVEKAKEEDNPAIRDWREETVADQEEAGPCSARLV